MISWLSNIIVAICKDSFLYTSSMYPLRMQIKNFARSYGFKIFSLLEVMHERMLG